MYSLEFPSPFGETLGNAKFKSIPQDFRVIEIPSFSPCGQGEHVWLKITKTGLNTSWVAEQLAKQSGIKLRDVSYAGRKDKQSVSTQWYSLYDPKRLSDEIEFVIPDCVIEKRIRHLQKLRIGNLEGNKFEIHLREFDGDIVELEKRISQIEKNGFPNYFGVQRFGRNFQNIEKATRWVKQGGGRLRREQRSLYFSTLRSLLFNKVLAARVIDNTWNKILPGELIQLAGSHSVFQAEEIVREDIQLRCSENDLHPTGPLFGKADISSTFEALKIEKNILEQYPDLSTFLLNEAKAARRALRVIPESIKSKFFNDQLKLSFTLPAGSYATVMLQSLGILFKKNTN